ncbi:MAG: DUF1194 domain-containing protein [Alphaproteobacteria bacterium]
MRYPVLLAAALILFCAQSSLLPRDPAMAQRICPMSLVLAVDVSSSVDRREYRLQSEGLALALTDPAVMEHILATGGLWLSAFEWSGRFNHQLLLDWTYLNDLASIVAAADAIRSVPRSTNEYPTAMGYAMGYASLLMQRAPERCLRRVIDVAGDGVTNDGFHPVSAYRAFDFGDVTINGLVILGAEPDPLAYYQQNVIRGPGAFIEVAEGYDNYAIAMRRKLIREITGGRLASLD